MNTTRAILSRNGQRLMFYRAHRARRQPGVGMWPLECHGEKAPPETCLVKNSDRRRFQTLVKMMSHKGGDDN